MPIDALRSRKREAVMFPEKGRRDRWSYRHPWRVSCTNETARQGVGRRTCAFVVHRSRSATCLRAGFPATGCGTAFGQIVGSRRASTAAFCRRADSAISHQQYRISEVARRGYARSSVWPEPWRRHYPLHFPRRACRRHGVRSTSRPRIRAGGRSPGGRFPVTQSGLTRRPSGQRRIRPTPIT